MNFLFLVRVKRSSMPTTSRITIADRLRGSAHRSPGLELLYGRDLTIHHKTAKETIVYVIRETTKIITVNKSRG